MKSIWCGCAVAVLAVCLNWAVPFIARAQESNMITQESRQANIVAQESWLAGYLRMESLLAGSRGSKEEQKYVYLPPSLDAYSADNAETLKAALAGLRAGRPVSPVQMRKFNTEVPFGGPGEMEFLLGNFAEYRRTNDRFAVLAAPSTITGPMGSKFTFSPPKYTAPPFTYSALQKDANGELKRVELSFPDEKSAMDYIDRAAEWRLPPLRFAHTLGAVRVETNEREGRRHELQEQINELERKAAANQRYLRDTLDPEIARLRNEFGVKADIEVARMAPFEAALNRAKAGLEPPRRQPSPSASDNSQKDAAALRAQRGRRLAQVEKALTALFAEENENGTSEFTRARVEELDLERAELEAMIDAADRPAEPAALPPSPEEMARYKKARAQYQSEAFISRARLRSLAIAYEVKEERRVETLGELAGYAAKVMELEAKLAKLGGADIPPFSSLKTHDASLLFDAGASDERIRLNELIAEQTQWLRETERQHLQAAQNVQRLSDSVFETAMDDRNSTIKSYIYQAVLQWAVQSADAAQSSKGHPGTFVAMASSQIAFNLMSPPRFYDVNINRETDELFITNMPPDIERVEKEAGKTAGATIARPMAEQAGIKALQAALKRASRSPRLANLKALSAMRSSLGDMAANYPGKNSKGGSVARAIFLDFLTEEGKAKLAKVLQEDDVRAHISAQEALGHALALRAVLSDLRDTDREILDTYQADRAKLRPGLELSAAYEHTPGIKIERNDPFDPDAGYALTLELEGKDKSVLSQVRLQLGGIDLERTTWPGRFVISAAAAEALEAADPPEKLPVTIILEEK